MYFIHSSTMADCDIFPMHMNNLFVEPQVIMGNNWKKRKIIIEHISRLYVRKDDKFVIFTQKCGSIRWH